MAINKSKRLFTILEVLIATSLSAVILTTLMFFYRQVDLLNRKVDKLEQKAFMMSYVQSRLNQTIAKSIASSNSNNSDYFFFTSQASNESIKERTPSLLFTYDNGVQLDKPFSNTVLGRLYIDNYNALRLSTWPSPKRWSEFNSPPIKNEILMENIKSLTFAFYVSPEKDVSPFLPKSKASKGDPDLPIEPKDHWHTDWKQEYRQLPAIIKLTIVPIGDTPPIVVSFPLPNSKMWVVYDH